jgi:hypothetical protein
VLQYTDLAKQPGFDLKKLRQEHKQRQRSTELARSKKAQEVSGSGKAQKTKRAQARKARADEDPEEWSDGDEERDYNANLKEKCRVFDEASWDDDAEIIVEKRPKSKRAQKRSRKLESYDCAEEPESPPQPVAEKEDKEPRAQKQKVPRKRVVQTATAHFTEASAGIAKKRNTKKIAKKKTAKSDAHTAHTAPVVTTAAPPPPSALVVPVPMRKRKAVADVKVIDLTAQEAGVVADALEVESGAVELSDKGVIDDLLVKQFAHVSNIIVDDYLRLLKQKLGWPNRTLVESTARWTSFEAQENSNVARALFVGGDGKRLDGITRIIWPMYGRGHFAVVVIYVEKAKIELFDSLPTCAKNWNLKFLQKLLRTAFGWRKDAVVTYPDCRDQDNGHDCGVYVMANVRSLLEGIDVNHKRMPGKHLKNAKDKAVSALRKRFAFELLKGKLTDWK